ncbi:MULTISPECIES: MarR family transcriptional regulator [unclassified Streptomyces]|uniref:MarR family winged helix-turn-helix transcriptional regulator n=1 Tax=unclassified Streptomyces TaxID=2593676 RepID=UPI000364F17F|nr:MULTISPECIES: MarR family transcriptional regulator [unclassified Streptomyces]MYY00863.1 MarR family transcriptional regulator [Streptomyces sp. SID4913]
MGIATALVRSAFLVNAVYADSGREHGITAQQGQLLCVLMLKPYGMRELGTVLGLAKSSLTGLVDRSVQRGLVCREADPEDGRAVRVALTGAGSELAEVFHEETSRRVEALADGVDAPDRELLAALLGRLVLDNKVPVVFRGPCENAPTATPGC